MYSVPLLPFEKCLALFVRFGKQGPNLISALIKQQCGQLALFLEKDMRNLD